MNGKTNIEWTHIPGFIGESWNPFVGCDIVSKGCTNCYAMKMASRIVSMQGESSHYAGTVKTVKGKPVWTGKVNPAPDKTWTAPLRAKKPRCYFVNSMGDVFHEDVPETWIDRLFAVMALSPQHRFLILTKRPERMRAYMSAHSVELRDRWWRAVPAGTWPVSIMEAYAAIHPHASNVSREIHRRDEPRWPLPNVWLGTSVEDQASANERIPHLLATPAAIRFVSAEPLLGPVDLTPHLFIYTHGDDEVLLAEGDPLPVLPFHDPATTPIEDIATPRLDWVIAGGESGPGARPCHPDWPRGLRDQCAAAQVPFFFKQWGAWGVCGHMLNESTGEYDRPMMKKVGKAAAGHELDGQTHHAWPEAGA